MKLGGTAAKRVKESVKHTKPALHCCGHTRGMSCGRRSGTGAARGTGITPVKGNRAGDGQWHKQEQGAGWWKYSLKKRVFAPLVKADARLLCKEEIWTKRVFKKSSHNHYEEIHCSNFLALVLVTISYRYIRWPEQL